MIWLNLHVHPALKILGLLLGIALIFASWNAGVEWWTARVKLGLWYAPRMGTRLEKWGVPLAFALLAYIFSVIERNYYRR